MQALENKIAETKKRITDELEQKDREHSNRIAALQRAKQNHENTVSSLKETAHNEEVTEHVHIQPMVSMLQNVKSGMGSLWTQVEKISAK